MAAGTEDGTIANIGAINKNPSFIKMFKTKASGILLTKFTWRNFLYTVGVYN